MDSREKFQLLENKADAVLSLKPDEVTDGLRSVVDNVSQELVIGLSKLGSEAPELKSLTEDLSNQLNSKRKDFRKMFIEGENPFAKKGDKDKDKDDEDEKEKKDKKEEPKDKEKKDQEESVEEGTSGSADSGFHRWVDYEARPASGEGWPINVNDAGCLNGINDGVDEFMSKAEPIPEEKDEDEKEEKGETDEDVQPSRSEQLVEIALKIISTEKTEQNAFARAFAAAFLMENNKRVTESQAYARVVEKLQEKLQEAAETGEITLTEVDTTELEEKLEAAYSAIEQLESRHRLLSAKVYAEQELRKIGQHENPEARKTVAEAIRKAATKTSIDETILGLAPVKGLKVTKPVDRELKEEKSEKATDNKTLEGTVAKLAEETARPKTSFEGAELGKYLSDSINYSRSTPR